MSQVKDPCGERSSAGGIDDSWKDSFGRPIVSIPRLFAFLSIVLAHTRNGWTKKKKEKVTNYYSSRRRRRK